MNKRLSRCLMLAKTALSAVLLTVLAAVLAAGASAGDIVFRQSAKILPSDLAEDLNFGQALSLSADTLVVGALAENDGGSSAGAAYIFERNRGGTDTWGQTKKLAALDRQNDDRFGVSVSIDADTAAVGASSHRLAGQAVGVAYLFTRDQGGADAWGQSLKLNAADAAAGDRFGFPVILSGDILAVGARFADAAGQDSGAVYLFSRNQGGANAWGQIAKLSVAGAQFFGATITLAGDTVAVGADNAVYVFERSRGGANNWGQVAKLRERAAAAPGADVTIAEVALAADTLIVGEINDDGAVAGSGAAYIFARNRGGADNWGQAAKLSASDGAADDFFGGAVALDGDLAVVVAQGDDDDGELSGSLYAFRREGATAWRQIDKFSHDDAVAFNFAASLAAVGDTVISGVPLRDDACPGCDSGAAYVFRASSGVDVIFNNHFER